MFIPKRVLFEKDALNYEMGSRMYDFFNERGNVEIVEIRSNRIKGNIPGHDIYSLYREGKNTLVVGVKRKSEFQTCKPSAHYQLPLLSGCIGQCEYCYLNTNLGYKPYMKVNVNIEDILGQAKKYMEDRLPKETIFEGSATSDPIPVEPYTNSLRRAIEFFSTAESGRFRFVTKFTDVDTLLDAAHGDKTEIRFTLNTDRIINDFENRTPSMGKRIEACRKVIKSGYPTGFIIAPVFLYDGWKEDYRNLLISLKDSLPETIPHPLTFEVISHRYTTRAKNVITQVFPDTQLPMDESGRVYKHGQFGYGKYVYNAEKLEEMKDFFRNQIDGIFENHIIKYII